jgi:LPXTG-motif cell wall-anchored protein
LSKSLKGVVDITSGFSYYTTLTTVNFFSSSSIIFAGCVSIYPESNGPTTVRARANDSDLATTAISGPVTMWGQPVMVEFQQKDLTLFSTSVSTSSTRSATASPSATTKQAAVTSTAPPTPGTNPNSGLSTGAKAGIGVGIAIGALFLLGVAFFFLRRKRKAGQNKTNGLEGIAELPRNEIKPKELHGDHLVQNDRFKGSAKQGPVNELEA